MAVVEVVRWLPVVEDFITVLDWLVECGKNMACQQYIAGNLWFEFESCLWRLRRPGSAVSYVLMSVEGIDRPTLGLRSLPSSLASEKEVCAVDARRCCSPLS